MLVLPSSLVGDLRGSLGSSTLKLNRSGLTMQRRKSKSITPDFRYNSICSSTSIISQLWRSLPSVTHDLWNTYAQNESVTDVFGRTFSLSGFNLFCKRNIFLRSVNESFTMNPICPVFVPSFTVSNFVFSISLVSMVFDVAAFDPSLKFRLRFSPPLSAGIAHLLNPVRTIYYQSGTGLPFPFDITSAYEFYFGKLWLKYPSGHIQSDFTLFHIASGKVLLYSKSFITITP